MPFFPLNNKHNNGFKMHKTKRERERASAKHKNLNELYSQQQRNI